MHRKGPWLWSCYWLPNRCRHTRPSCCTVRLAAAAISLTPLRKTAPPHQVGGRVKKVKLERRLPFFFLASTARINKLRQMRIPTTGHMLSIRTPMHCKYGTLRMHMAGSGSGHISLVKARTCTIHEHTGSTGGGGVLERSPVYSPCSSTPTEATGLRQCSRVLCSLAWLSQSTTKKTPVENPARIGS